MDNKQPPKRVNVNITPEDTVECECGSKGFVPVLTLANPKNPLVGGPPMIVPLGQGYQCAKCGEAIKLKNSPEKKPSLIKET